MLHFASRHSCGEADSARPSQRVPGLRRLFDVVDDIVDKPGSLPGSSVDDGRLSASARADLKNDMVALFDRVDAVDVEAKFFLPFSAGSSMEADSSAAGPSAATSSAMPLAGRGKL
jgi:hypothetical protein